jgi:hypothetical protein
MLNGTNSNQPLKFTFVKEGARAMEYVHYFFSTVLMWYRERETGAGSFDAIYYLYLLVWCIAFGLEFFDIDIGI